MTLHGTLKVYDAALESSTNAMLTDRRHSEVLSHLGEVQVEAACAHCSKRIDALNLELIMEDVRERGFSLEDQPFLCKLHI